MKQLVHRALNHLYKEERDRFLSALHNPEAAQNKVLKEAILNAEKGPFWKSLGSIQNYSEWVQKVPVTNYSFYKDQIDRQEVRSHRHWTRWEPTSGSTQSRKWIPYNQDFLAQLNRASSPWLADLYQRNPGIQKGTHYWSLSWLPQELRKNFETDDSELFPFWQRIFLKKIFPVPSHLAKNSSLEAFWFASLVFLAAQKDLTLVSVWSPTFLLQVVRDLLKNWEVVQETLKQGQWMLFQKELLNVRAPIRKDLPDLGNENFFRLLWPQLSLISCWTSASSKNFVPEIKNYFPNVQIQGKGLWSTEAVVTIPFQDQYPLAINSHYFEFRNLDDLKIIPLHKLREGMSVQPIVSTGNGFLRYEIEDVMKVESFLNLTPSLKFMGRQRAVDMVGEKMDHILAQKIIDELNREFQGKFFSLKASMHPEPHYQLVCSTQESEAKIEQALVQRLKGIHHYALAAELKQLGTARVLNFSDETAAMQSLSKSAIAGQNKIEPLICDF